MDNSIYSLVESIHAPAAGLTQDGQERLNNLTKPKGSLGRLEELALMLWRIQGTCPLQVDPAAMITVAADHGVAAEGISLYPQEVTRQMVVNFLNNGAAINVLSGVAGIKHYIIDAGCKGEDFPEHPYLIRHKIGQGTKNFCEGPAMTAGECWECINLGVSTARSLAASGVRCMGIGEMGIGNTTAASALFAAYFELVPEAVTGQGAGLPLGGLAHKSQVLHKALRVNSEAVQSGEPFAILSALGGFEIATMAGLILGGAGQNMVLVIDGFISTAAYLAAWKMCPAVCDYCVFSHLSKEGAHELVLSYLDEKPLLDLGMRLGEGTGAALGIFMLRAAAAIFNDMSTFDSAGISGALLDGPEKRK